MNITKKKKLLKFKKIQHTHKKNKQIKKKKKKKKKKKNATQGMAWYDHIYQTFNI